MARATGDSATVAKLEALGEQKMAAGCEAGEDLSRLQCVGLRCQGIHWRLDRPRLGLNLELPVFLIQGELDLAATPEIATAYFDSIAAPHKEYLLLPRAGPRPEPADARSPATHPEDTAAAAGEMTG